MQSLLKQTQSIYGTAKKSNGYLNCHSLKLIYFCMMQILYCITTWCHGNWTILSNFLQ